MMAAAKKTGIIVLAAGGSSRMGTAKQLLPYQNVNFLRRIIDQVLSLEYICPLVVVGANAQSMRDALKGYTFPIIENSDWASGLASSIRAGLTSLLERYPGINACLFVVCDQPFLDSEILKKIIQKQQESDKGIVAAAYGDVVGTPVLFSSYYFDKILNLRLDEGAKKIIYQYREDLDTFSFPKGAIDVDTPDDYEALINGSHPH